MTSFVGHSNLLQILHIFQYVILLCPNSVPSCSHTLLMICHCMSMCLHKKPNHNTIYIPCKVAYTNLLIMNCYKIDMAKMYVCKLPSVFQIFIAIFPETLSAQTYINYLANFYKYSHKWYF